MRYIDWQPNMVVPSPVYLDANILVGTIVNNHPLYASCVQLTANILIAKATILVSVLSLDESMWATAKLAYCQLNNHPSTTTWNRNIYQKWCDRIFESYRDWITAPGNMVQDWKKAGINVDVVPTLTSEFEDIADSVPKYMRQFKLTPADAFHLAIAEKRAKALVTADSDFGKLQLNPPDGDLIVMHVQKPQA